MKKQLDLVKTFHKKFRAFVSEEPSLIPKDRSNLRYVLMHDEVEEYLHQGVENDNIEIIAKELCDILYCVYGTVIEHGLQDKIEEIFEEVHRSNMSKDYGPGKMIKGKDYFPANIHKFFKNHEKKIH